MGVGPLAEADLERRCVGPNSPESHSRWAHIFGPDSRDEVSQLEAYTTSGTRGATSTSREMTVG